MILKIVSISIIIVKLIKYVPLLYEGYFLNKKIEYSNKVICADLLEHCLLFVFVIKYHSIQLLLICSISLINLGLIIIKKNKFRKRKRKRRRNKKKFMWRNKYRFI